MGAREEACWRAAQWIRSCLEAGVPVIPQEDGSEHPDEAEAQREVLRIARRLEGRGRRQRQRSGVPAGQWKCFVPWLHACRSYPDGTRQGGGTDPCRGHGVDRCGACARWSGWQ